MPIRILAVVFSCVSCVFSTLSFASVIPFVIPFNEEQATVVSQDGTKLNGVWTLPSKEIKAVVVLLQGSGNVDADGDVTHPFVGSGYKGATPKLSKQVAEALASVGVASLRYTKRGYTPDPSKAVYYPIDLLVQDAKAALVLAKAKFSGLKTALVGFSEGAIVATLVAAETPADALFLLSLNTRSIDDMLGYLLLQWPVELVKARVDLNHDGELSAAELPTLGKNGSFPMLDPSFSMAGLPWEKLDANADGKISVVSELIPAYQKFHASFLFVLDNVPTFSAWYHSLQAVPAFSVTAKKITSPVYLYHSIDDTQVNWNWIASDQRFFPGPKKLTLFSGLGHCFSPLQGVIGDVKTSGPFDSKLIQAITADVAAAF